MEKKSTEPPTVPERAASATAADPTSLVNRGTVEEPAPAADAEAAPIVAVDPTVRICEDDFVSIFTDT
jgi:hypothetical protein